MPVVKSLSKAGATKHVAHTIDHGGKRHLFEKNEQYKQVHLPAYVIDENNSV